MRTLLVICAFLCGIPIISGSDKKVVCYWNSFSVKNEGLKGMFEVKDIDPKICTHIIYTYLRFTASMIFFPDYIEDDLRAFKNLKSQNANIKLLVGVGGPRQGAQIPSQIASTPQNRKAFSEKVKKFIDDYEFDGCDFDWQWPGQDDRDNYVSMLQDLRSELTSNKVFSISVAPRQEDIEKSYDVTKIHQHVDFINLNTFNFHGIIGETVTAFHSPYRKALDDETKEGEWNAVSVVENWLSKGVPPPKLTLGIPTYGKSFTLNDILQTGVGAPVDGLGQQSEYLAENTNIIPYVEICYNKLTTNPKWFYYWNSAQFAPFAVFNANQWVGFDDLQVVRAKIHLALSNDLGGLNYATIDRDDFTGQCTGSKFPLIKMGYDAMVNDIIPPNPLETTTIPPTTTTTTTTTTPTTTRSTTTRSTTPTTTRSTTPTTTRSTTPTTTRSTTTPTTTTAVSKDPDNDDKNTTTVTEPLTTPTTTTTLPTTTTTTTKKSTVPKTTVTRTTTTRTTTSENPTPPITPNRVSTFATTKSDEDEQDTTPITTTVSTTTTEEIEVTTTKKLPITTPIIPTPPLTPRNSVSTTQSSQSTQTLNPETPATGIVHTITSSSVHLDTTVTQTTSSRTTPYNIPTPPVTPGKSKAKRSADFFDDKSFACPEENGKFRNPDDCSSYFVCVENVPYKFYCNYEKSFDELNNHCDYQSKLIC